MSALEHFLFVLSRAVETDEVGKAELVRILDVLMNATSKVSDTEELQRLSIKIGRRFDRVINPKE